LAVALVDEVVELMDYLLAALLDIEFERFEGRTVVLLETEPAGGLTPRCHDPGADREILGVEVPEPRETREGSHAGESRRPPGASARPGRYPRVRAPGAPVRPPRCGRNPSPVPPQDGSTQMCPPPRRLRPRAAPPRDPG